jgi:hypothetical protein
MRGDAQFGVHECRQFADSTQAAVGVAYKLIGPGHGVLAGFVCVKMQYTSYTRKSQITPTSSELFALSA